MAKRTFSSAGETMQLTDGRTLGYLEMGDPGGRPVFMFHGAPGSRLAGAFLDEPSRKAGIRLIGTERPGYGLSSAHRNRTYLDWASDMSELADHLGVREFAVMGVSSGGPYAAAVAHEIPERVTVAAIVSGDGPYARNDFPESVLSGDTFSGSGLNKTITWLARAPWLMRGLWAAIRVFALRDPAGFIESTADAAMPEHDLEFFSGENLEIDLAEAFREGASGAAQDYVVERRDWPFKHENIDKTTVLVFHGEQDTTVDPGVARYICELLPSCEEPIMFAGEGHSIFFYRFDEIIQAMFEASG